MSSGDFDVIIIGSGAGGGVAAYVLAKNGLRVALVEKGRNVHPTLTSPILRGSLLSNDEIKLERWFAFQDPFIEPRTYMKADGGKFVGDVQNLTVAVGGGTIHYDADSPRLQNIDFNLLSTFGAVEGADVVDWPFDYEELAPYYDEVERLLGVQGRAGANPFEEPRGEYPMPPGYPSKAGLTLSRGARELGYHPHPMPMAINSIYYRGRPACANCGFCGYGCPINAKGSTAVTVIRDALLTANCTLFAECKVTKIETTPSGERATGVRYIAPKGDEQTLTAGHIIVAANAIETPRLMLLSANSAHPNGLGNANDLVGRYMMFHTVFSVIALFDEEIRSYRGRPITHALADFTVPNGDSGYIRGGYVELGGSIHPVREGRQIPWLAHKSIITGGRYRRKIATVSMMGEDMPVYTNRVQLDPEVRDVYGQLVAQITYVRHPHDQAMVDYYLPKMREIAEAAGAKETMDMDFDKRDPAPNASKHLLGSMRMGDEPSKSVCNRWGRLHTVENVWVADGSIWPTSASFNPVLTQQALAYRTAAYIVNPKNPKEVLP
ncbi:MAG: GMC family oxidoreductase [Myxococcota bacterium]